VSVQNTSRSPTKQKLVLVPGPAGDLENSMLQLNFHDGEKLDACRGKLTAEQIAQQMNGAASGSQRLAAPSRESVAVLRNFAIEQRN
jgi:hypothetical protein